MAADLFLTLFFRTPCTYYVYLCHSDYFVRENVGEGYYLEYSHDIHAKRLPVYIDAREVA